MFGLIYIVESNQPGNFIDEPRSLGDWLNLVQFAIVWLMFLLLCVFIFFRLGPVFSDSAPIQALPRASIIHLGAELV